MSLASIFDNPYMMDGPDYPIYGRRKNPFDTIGRLRNFNQQEEQSQAPISWDEEDNDVDEPQIEGQEPNRIQSSFSDIYQQLANQQSGPHAKEYADYVKNLPTREQYKPGKLNKLGAILSGVSETIKGDPARGIALTQHILDEPYNRAVDDYKLKGAGLKEAANQEEKDMGRRVSLARTIATDVHNTEGEKLRGRELDIRVSKMKADEKIAMRRALSSGAKFVTNKNTGESFMTFPQYGEDGVTPIGTLKLPMGKTDESIPEATKRKIQEFGAQQSAIGNREVKVEGVRQSGRTKLEDMRQSGALDLEGVKAAGAEELAEKKGEITSRQISERGTEARDTKKVPSGTKTGGITSSNMQHREQLNRMEKFLAKNPDAKKYFHTDDKGRVYSLKAPGMFGSQEEYDTIVNYIYGKDKK